MTLRERRRVETTHLIREAALKLARDKGVAQVTVEAICAVVGVSPRTFFNYFPFKEAVFVMPAPPLPQAAVDRFVAASGDMMIDLIDLMVAQAEEMEGGHFGDDLLFEIAQAHPRLVPLQMAEFQKFDEQLRQLIARRLNLIGDDLPARVLASAIIGANRPMMDRMRQSSAPDFPELVRKSLSEFVEIIRAVPSDTPVAPSPSTVRRAKK